MSEIVKHERDRTEEAAMLPAVNVIEDSTGITLYADMPGVPKGNLDIRVESENLIVEGALGLNMPDGMEAVHAEVGLPRYRRVFTLSRELDSEKISAEFENGVLRLRIPKAEHAQPRKITVQAG